jgi:signal transduction histidine kinase
MQPRLAKKGHELVKDYDKNLAQVPADDKLLRIVFQNFLSNAIKYTSDHGKIKVALKSDESNITFSVANNGKPIPEADQPRIFTKMFRASNAQELDPDGNGLGLYVVKEIVENAGGKIWFTSKNGEDTVFACSFPLSGMIAKSGTRQLN